MMTTEDHPYSARGLFDKHNHGDTSTRMWRRGADSDGFVANFLETEQIKQLNRTVHLLFRNRCAIEELCTMDFFDINMRCPTDIIVNKRRVFIHGSKMQATMINPADIAALEHFRTIMSPTNPFLSCVDIELVSKLCHDKEALVCIDGTFATPLNQKALALGGDIVLHSSALQQILGATMIYTDFHVCVSTFTCIVPFERINW